MFILIYIYFRTTSPFLASFSPGIWIFMKLYKQEYMKIEYSFKQMQW